MVERKLWSAALAREMSYAVYLPPGYDSAEAARYPVLYMLHGLGGNYLTWKDDGLFDAATELIRSGEIGPMIIVTPEGERGYWIDQAGSGPRFGSYVSRDLVATIDGEYRTLPNRLMRAIGGMSMGGHGALQLALNNPDKFGVIGAHSVALRRHDQAFAYFGDKQYFEANDPVSLCSKNPLRAKRFSIWVDIGTKDGWYGAAEAFHRQLDGAGVAHQWNVFRGEHDDAYWSAHVADYLRFYSHSFGTATAYALPSIEG
ncbi:MAG TPA: alpha/beta hydrolase-fold protein [Dehalococcoidia bacterium]|nr:alpha/beta hydrolase-fold protein [Dehalococcoidia bacterium]